jgi:predicted enzyme related to lactoylglutathione lyase
MKSLISNLGGAFIYADDPQTLADWYKDTLGIEYEKAEEYNSWYCSFAYQDLNGRDAYTVWSILQAEEGERGSTKVFTINYRVGNMEDVVRHLEDKGVAFDGPESYDQGKFLWIQDAEGNDIELWEDTAITQKPAKPEEN